MTDEKIAKINEVITTYFEDNETINWIPLNKIMPALIEAGVFYKDEKKGLPIRKIVRKLDNDFNLDLIPTVHAERNDNTVYWYLVREGEKYEPKQEIPLITKRKQRLLDIQNSDEYYLVNLCDEILGKEASRKHTFESIVGNLHKRGKGRTKLPVDAYYEDLKLVIEFRQVRESQEELSEQEKARLEQIAYYDDLKKKGVLKKELRLISIQHTQFDLNDSGVLIRDKEKDLSVVKNILKEYL